jgi:hypothetical protein
VADQIVSQNVVPFVEQLPEDMIDPEAKRRLIHYTERLDSVFRVDERGRMVADVQELRDLAANGDFFAPLMTKALSEVLAEADGRELVDERGRMQALTKAQLEQFPREPSVESINRFIAEIDPDIARRLKGLKIPVIGDQPPPTQAEDFPAIPPDEVPDKLQAFKDCLKQNLGAFALAMVLVVIGAILAVVGVFVPPVESVAAWIILTVGVVVGGYVIGCLVGAGLLRQD